MNKKIKAAAALIITIAAAGFFSAAVSAEQIDLNRTGSLTIRFVSAKTGEAITESEFTIYKVAELSEEDNYLIYTYTGDFYYCTEDLSGSLNRSLAEKLAEYAEENNAKGTAKAISSDGTAEFDNLDLGLYLVIETKASYYYYSSGPFLAALPVYENDSWVYDITASPKPQSKSGTETTETTTEGGGGGGDKTTTEKTETTTEGTETTTEGTETTTEGGGGGSSYHIGDPDPDPGKTPSGSPSPGTPSSPEDTPDDPDDPDEPDEPHEPDEPDKPDEPHEPDEPGKPNEPEDDIPKLPQTGQNNLPVPILALSGLGLFSAGWKLYFTGGREKDET